MTTKDEQVEELTSGFDTGEAGVAELFDFYSRIEPIYSELIRASSGDEEYTSNSANING